MIERLRVSLHFSDQAITVGEMVRQDKKIYFRYDAQFLDTRLQLSPFQLKANREIQTPDTQIFAGLFGVFADSLPDGWGRLLLDRTLVSKGRNLNEISSLDRLAIVGTSGMGALTYHPVQSLEDNAIDNVDLDLINTASQQVLAGESSEQLEELVQLGGSSGGARPKIIAGFNPEQDKIIPTASDLPQGYEHWLIKFPASIDPPHIANIELAYYHMALAAGLQMAPCRLFTGPSGKSYFGTKRFDRIGNQRLHLHSAAGLLHDNFRLTNIDYGHVMDAAFHLENDVQAYEKILRLAAFNIFAHNRDDHSKNISFLMSDVGEWTVAPAYDLTFSQSAHGHHSMTVFGESLQPGIEQLIGLSKNFSIKKPEQIIEEVREAVRNWSTFGKMANVPINAIRQINNVLNP